MSREPSDDILDTAMRDNDSARIDVRSRDREFSSGADNADYMRTFVTNALFGRSKAVRGRIRFPRRTRPRPLMSAPIIGFVVEKKNRRKRKTRFNEITYGRAYGSSESYARAHATSDGTHARLPRPVSLLRTHEFSVRARFSAADDDDDASRSNECLECNFFNCISLILSTSSPCRETLLVKDASRGSVFTCFPR